MEYTNLQQEIIKIFKYDLPEEQLIDIKKIVQNYLIENIDQSIDNLIYKMIFHKKIMMNGWMKILDPKKINQVH